MRAPADGYTLHLTATSDAINATFYEKLNFNLRTDIAPIASLIRGPFVMMIAESTTGTFILNAEKFPGARPGSRVFKVGN